MAISYVGEVANRAAHFAPAQTAPTVTIATAPGAGHLLVLRVCNSNNKIASVADSKGNTWTVVDTAGTSGIACLAYTFQNVGTLAISDTVTCTITGGLTTANLAAAIDEFSGVASLDVSNKASFTSTTSRSCGSVTTTNAADLIYAVFAANTTGETFTQGSGYTALTSYSVSGASFEVEGEYQIVAATGTYSPTGTGTATVSGGGVVAAFKATGVSTTTLNPAGIATREAFGTPTLRAPQSIFAVGGIRSGEAFGTGDSYALLEAFQEGAAQTSGYQILLSPIGATYGAARYGGSSAASLSVPSNTRLTVSAAGRIGSSEAVGTPVLRVMGLLQTVRPAVITTGEAWGQPSLFAVDRTSSSYGGLSLADGLVYTGTATDANIYNGAIADQPFQTGSVDDAPVYQEQVTDILVRTGGLDDTPGH